MFILSSERIILSNKPLVEAIFEIRWDLVETEIGSHYDPHYPILIGSLYDKVKNDYPIHEQLPTSNIPHEMAEYIVQHRFKDKDNWPLMQVGPGIFTFNDTEKYVWEDFISKTDDAVEKLFLSYQVNNGFKINHLELRYIDAIPFDYNSNVLDYIRDKMKIGLNIPENLFLGVDVNAIPSGYDIRLIYDTMNPEGKILLRLGRGVSKDEPVIIWETNIRSRGPNVPQDREGITAWLIQAHDLADNWFFKIIEGDLLEEFK